MNLGKIDWEWLEASERAHLLLVEAAPTVKIGHVLTCLISARHITHPATLWPLQIERIKPFGEPAVDRSEKLASLIPLALIAPELGK